MVGLPRGRKRLKSTNLSPTEDYEQISLVQWLDFHRIPHFHIPNGGSRNLLEGVKMKRLGVKAGIPDLCLPFPRHGFAALYIELKRREGGRITPEQEKWLTALNELGNKAVVARGCEEAIRIIEAYIGR